MATEAFHHEITTEAVVGAVAEKIFQITYHHPSPAVGDVYYNFMTYNDSF